MVLLPSDISPGEIAVIGGKSGARMRKGIELDSARYGELKAGEEIQVLAHDNAIDGTARTQVVTVAGGRVGWVSTKFLGRAPAGASSGAPPPRAPGAGTLAPPSPPPPSGPFAALALEPKRNDGITWNDHQGIMAGERVIEVSDSVAAAARVCHESDWESGARDVAKTMKKAELAPLHFAALRLAQRETNGRVLDLAASRHSYCAASIGADGATKLAGEVVTDAAAKRIGRLLTFCEKRGGTESALERVPGRVSVCVSTRRGERRHHRRLYRAFVDCDWVDKELVVLDVTPGEDTPSPFFTDGIKIEPVDCYENGDRVEARYQAGRAWLPATVVKRHWSGDVYDLRYDHVEKQTKAKAEEKEMPTYMMRRLDRKTGRGAPGSHRYVRQHWNEHLSAGELRNSLVALATGEFVAFYDPARRVYAGDYVTAMVDALRKTRAEMVCLHDRYAIYAEPSKLHFAREVSSAEDAAVDEATGLPAESANELDDVLSFWDASTFVFRASAFRPKLHPPAAPRFEADRPTSGGCFDDRSYKADRTFKPLTVGLRDDRGLFARLRAAPPPKGGGDFAPPRAAERPPGAAGLERLAAEYADTLRDVAPSGAVIARHTAVHGRDKYGRVTTHEYGGGIY